MSISEYSVNTNNKCGNCKDFYKPDDTDIMGECTSLRSRARNKSCRTEFSKACYWQRRIK